MARKHKVSIKTPHAAVIIWNYKNRLGSHEPRSTDPEFINDTERRILSTVSLVDIKTNKSKGNPVGHFELTLAPTKNWVGVITSGSWLAVLMSQDPIGKKDLTRASKEKLKMFGRIDSVRVSVQVNPETGARQTLYKVIGQDWGTVFTNNLYIDPILLENAGLGTAGNMEFSDIADQNKDGFQSSTEMVRSIIRLWGAPLSNKKVNEVKAGRLTNPTATFTIPRDVSKYFNFYTDDGSGYLSVEQLQKQKEAKEANGAETRTDRNNSKILKNIVDILNLYTGKLKSKTSKNGQYEPIEESFGKINPADIYGMHSVWQVLVSHGNPTINEAFCDLKWDAANSKQGVRPCLALYNRIRPFYLKNGEFKDNTDTFRGNGDYSDGSRGKDNQKFFSDAYPDGLNPAVVNNIISRFTDLTYTKIPLEEIISFEGGTNWRDKINFIEVVAGIPDQSMQSVSVPELKRKAQIADDWAFQREGFKPYMAQTKQLPHNPDSAILDYDIVASWKYLIKEWMFDIHRMLNGSITMMGQNDYISVGDNILVDADVLGPTNNLTYDHKQLKDKANLLLHVESVSHSFRVSPSGARDFITTIQFVRGIVVDSKGKIRKRGKGITDFSASSLSPRIDKNSENIIGTSSKLDPDPQKLKGN